MIKFYNPGIPTEGGPPERGPLGTTGGIPGIIGLFISSTVAGATVEAELECVPLL